jgi:hypothetical protein
MYAFVKKIYADVPRADMFFATWRKNAFTTEPWFHAPELAATYPKLGIFSPDSSW